MTSFDQCYPSVIKAEGGFVNNKLDPGGMTSLGVTKRAWQAWRVGPVTEADMRALTPEGVKPFYRAMYWNPVHCDSLPVGLAMCVFHCSVNAGPRRAAKVLQTIVGAIPDGAIGPATLAAVARGDQRTMIGAYQDALRAFYRGLPTFGTFGKGWINRANDVQQQAEALA